MGRLWRVPVFCGKRCQCERGSKRLHGAIENPERHAALGADVALVRQDHYSGGSDDTISIRGDDDFPVCMDRYEPEADGCYRIIR